MVDHNDFECTDVDEKKKSRLSMQDKIHLQCALVAMRLMQDQIRLQRSLVAMYEAEMQEMFKQELFTMSDYIKKCEEVKKCEENKKRSKSLRAKLMGKFYGLKCFSRRIRKVVPDMRQVRRAGDEDCGRSDSPGREEG